MRVVLLVLLLGFAAVGIAAEPASACAGMDCVPDKARCILESPTDTYRILSDCLQWIP